MGEDPEAADVIVAVHEGSGRVFAVAAFVGSDPGETTFYKVAGDWERVEDAAAHVLYQVVGLTSATKATITVHAPMVRPDNEDADAFHKAAGVIFDRTLPKGIGSA